ncbi:outer membrane protein assembly factor [Verminephrobacter eiseniae]|nr:outer membrane protein assembly factor [Verminephrobacter eiseniae]MCW5295918.1 outer membrane protein assembly factor [Verminephrobacter eiseniae]MCW8185577.1 outer membrane protein assembly factor [Verminephrobacter eiseniae]MCW8221569.1 outer membrane protein assembly factor [Verminephrobacter eiseniae]MCW8232608.1 outer membrane protein assembly factor [Verminephrobacter eiseniae]
MLRSTSIIPAPARWAALLLFNALSLQACSLLPNADKPDPAHADLAATATPAFAVELRAPDDVREVLERHLELLRFRHLSDLQRNELQRLLGAVDANARELLGTMGYFAPEITIESSQTPDSQEAPRTVVISVQTGAQTRIASADIAFAHGARAVDDAESRAQQRVRRNWSLAPGEPFTQSAWEAAKNDGLRQLQARRYPTARIVDSQAEIDADQHQARLSVTYDTGPAYRFGPLRLEGSQRYAPDGARRLARLPTGADYDEARMLDAQQRLASSGYYDSVFLTLDTEGSDPQAVPVVAQLREARLQKLVFGPGFSTDGGARLSLEHMHNRLPGLGWRAVSKLALERQAQSAGTEWTALPEDDGWRWFAGARLQREVNGDYDVDSARLRTGRSQSTQNIDRNYFLQYDAANSKSHNRQGLAAIPDSTAVSANYGWTGRYFNNPTAPTSGHGVALELGLGSTLRPKRDPFLRTLARWQSFIPAGRVQDAAGKGRNARVALRAEAGALLARADAPIPETELFLTGGDTTVRGYGYHSIGARTGDGQLHGGRYLAAGSLEWQRPIVYRGALSDWESTLFIDAGAVADRWGRGALRPLVGLGAGLRWRSPVGPLQTDLAYGLTARKLRLHLRLGFSF